MTTTRSMRAQDIYQGLLDDINDAYRSRDFSAFARRICLPHEIKTLEEDFVLRSMAELNNLFQSTVANLANSGVTHFVRRCLAAHFACDDEIIGTHESFLMRHTMCLEAPYPVKSVLRRTGGRWQVASSDNAVGRSSNFYHSLRSVSGGHPHEPSRKSSEKHRA